MPQCLNPKYHTKFSTMSSTFVLALIHCNGSIPTQVAWPAMKKTEKVRFHVHCLAIISFSKFINSSRPNQQLTISCSSDILVNRRRAIGSQFPEEGDSPGQDLIWRRGWRRCLLACRAH